jgi:hypothetical protein
VKLEEEDLNDSAMVEEVTTEQYLECAWLCNLSMTLSQTQPHYRALKGLPVVLNEVFQALCSATGWSFMVMGRLHPRLHGEIATMRYVLIDLAALSHLPINSFHQTPTGMGSNFGHVHPDFENAYMHLFLAFLRDKYCKYSFSS